MGHIIKPKIKSKFRRLAGREYFIFLRKIKWYRKSSKWAKQAPCKSFKNRVFGHKSIILRPLKNVDMYLQENKRTNLELAVCKINNVIIKPGETFSFWKLVGRPTKRKGYKEGLILNQGQISKDIGGGLCQLGNLLFWMFAHTPLTISERHRHSFDVFPDINRCIPFGAGATLSYNYIDLQIKNTTENIFCVKLWLDEQNLNGEIIAQKPVLSAFRVEEREHKFSQQKWGGYSRHNRIYRIETISNGDELEEMLVENHALVMYTPFLENK